LKHQQYITKTNPQLRSKLFFQNLAKYLELTRKLEEVEEVIIQLRLATMDIEQAILVEDVWLHQSSPTEGAPLEYFGNRLNYLELMEDLRGREISIMELKVAAMQLELAILQEELPYAHRRKQIAESHTQLEFDNQTRYRKSLSPSKGNLDTVTTPIIDSDSDTDTVGTVETSLSATPTLVSTSPKRKELAPFRHRARVRSN
jgi:hypothetical protein